MSNQIKIPIHIPHLGGGTSKPTHRIEIFAHSFLAQLIGGVHSIESIFLNKTQVGTDSMAQAAVAYAVSLDKELRGLEKMAQDAQNAAKSKIVVPGNNANN